MADEPTGVLIRGLLAGGAVRVLLAEATALAERTRRNHGLGEDAAALGAEAVVALALSSAHIKGEESLVLQIQSEAPAFSVYADLTAVGALRVRLTPPDLRLDRSDVRGMLLMVKHVAQREVYRGVTAIEGESLQAALSKHLGRSDQVDALLGLDVRTRDGAVTYAGGYLLERLPDDPGSPSLSQEDFTARYGWLRDADPREVLQSLALGGLSADDPVQVLDRRELHWRCRCSTGRIEAMLVALGPDELASMADEDHGAEVTCHFCNRRYRVTEARLRELRDHIPQA